MPSSRCSRWPPAGRSAGRDHRLRVAGCRARSCGRRALHVPVDVAALLRAGPPAAEKAGLSPVVIPGAGGYRLDVDKLDVGRFQLILRSRQHDSYALIDISTDGV